MDESPRKATSRRRQLIDHLARSDVPAERAEARELQMVDHLEKIREYLQFFVALALIALLFGFIGILTVASSGA